MPTLDLTIDDFVRADDLDIVTTASGYPAGQTVVEAWLTVREPNNPFTIVFSKHITGTLVAGQGQISDNGTGDGIAVMRFELVGGEAGETADLDAGVEYNFDIQTKTSAGKYYTCVARSKIITVEEITQVD